MTGARSKFDAYVATFRDLAVERGVCWDLPFDGAGCVPKESRWPLHEMLGAPTPPAYWLNDLGRDARTLEVLNEHRLRNGVPALEMAALGEGWRDLLKAVTIEQALPSSLPDRPAERGFGAEKTGGPLPDTDRQPRKPPGVSRRQGKRTPAFAAATRCD